jgi:hypothetical protein
MQLLNSVAGKDKEMVLDVIIRELCVGMFCGDSNNASLFSRVRSVDDDIDLNSPSTKQHHSHHLIVPDIKGKMHSALNDTTGGTRHNGSSIHSPSNRSGGEQHLVQASSATEKKDFHFNLPQSRLGTVALPSLSVKRYNIGCVRVT